MLQAVFSEVVLEFFDSRSIDLRNASKEPLSFAKIVVDFLGEFVRTRKVKLQLGQGYFGFLQIRRCHGSHLKPFVIARQQLLPKR